MIIHLPTHNELVMTAYLAEEILRVTEKLRIKRLDDAIAFLNLPQLAWFASIPAVQHIPHIRDKKDVPVLEAAIALDVDILISGDKDFTSLDIDRPRIMTSAQFIAEFMAE